MVTGSILPLRLSGACVRKRGQQIVGPIDLEVGEKGFTILMGPNGSGKTSLLRLMHGLERPAGGSVRWRVPETQARRRQSYVFQTPITMRRTVLENVAYPLCVHGAAKAVARARARDWLQRVGLADLAGRQAMVLSGGERQKMALARALVVDPEILFLDEPCANLDGKSTREIEAILQDAHHRGTRIVMATHDMGQARRLARDILFICHGRLLETGPADRFFNESDSREARAFLSGDILE